MNEPGWLKAARGHIGVTEIKGPKHNPTIVSWLRKLRAWWKDDETPWCGVFVAACMDRAGYSLPKNWMRAKDWLNWGDPLGGPVYGCVVVFGRPGGGHVGFAVGEDENGRLLVLGGNQGDAVKISPFDYSRVIGYRVPKGYAIPVQNYKLPTIKSDQETSKNEA